MTVRDILKRINYTVIIDGKEYHNRDITFGAWNERMIKQSESASGYTPKETFDPVARDNYQKFFAVAYYAGLIPAKVIETRTNEIGKDGCYVFTVETVGTLNPENDSTDSTPARYELAPTDGRKSFYGKAIVEVDKAGNKTLYSYGTAIIKRLVSGELVRLWNGWSATTGRHIKAFCGLNKAGFVALPHDATTYEKAAAYAGTLYR